MQIVISFALFPVIVITYCLLFSVSPCPLFKYKMGFPFFFVLFSNPDTFLSVSKGCVGFARVVANVTEVCGFDLYSLKHSKARTARPKK